MLAGIPHAELIPFVGAAIAPGDPKPAGNPHAELDPPSGATGELGTLVFGTPATSLPGTLLLDAAGISCGETTSVGTPVSGPDGTSCGEIPGESGDDMPGMPPAGDVAMFAGTIGTGTTDAPPNSSPAIRAITSAIPLGSSNGIAGAVGGGAIAAVASPGDELVTTLGPGARGTPDASSRSVSVASSPRSSCGGK